MFSKTFKKRNGQEFTITVDDKDRFLLESNSWFLRNGCAATTIHEDGESQSVYLHRLVLKSSIKRHEKKTNKRARIIFLDDNKLNCQSSNIKIQKEKGKGKGKKRGASKYRGVSFDTRNGKWRGKITLNKIVIIDKLFESEYSAWRALDEKKAKFNEKSPNKKLKREEWEPQSPMKSYIKSNNEIYETLKERIDDNFNKYFKNEDVSAKPASSEEILDLNT